MANWAPTRSGAHPPAQTIAAGQRGEFVMPERAEGFIIGADNLFMLTVDGSDASANNGLTVDPAKWGVSTLLPISPVGKVSIFNKGTQAVRVEMLWLEFVYA